MYWSSWGQSNVVHMIYSSMRTFLHGFPKSVRTCISTLSICEVKVFQHLFLLTESNSSVNLVARLCTLCTQPHQLQHHLSIAITIAISEITSQTSNWLTPYTFKQTWHRSHQINPQLRSIQRVLPKTTMWVRQAMKPPDPPAQDLSCYLSWLCWELDSYTLRFLPGIYAHFSHNLFMYMSDISYQGNVCLLH